MKRKILDLIRQAVGTKDMLRRLERLERIPLICVGNSRRPNGFVERFNGTVLDEFFRVKMRETFYETVEALQTDLDDWLVHYNTERPHLGYRNMGRRPIETVTSFVSQEG